MTTETVLEPFANELEGKVTLGDFQLYPANTMNITYMVKLIGKTRSDVVSPGAKTYVAEKAVQTFKRNVSVSLIDCTAAWAKDPDADIDVLHECNVELVHDKVESPYAGTVVFVDGKNITIKDKDGQERKVKYPSPRSRPAVKVGDNVKVGSTLFHKLAGLSGDDMVYVALWRVVLR